MDENTIFNTLPVYIIIRGQLYMQLLAMTVQPNGVLFCNAAASFDCMFLHVYVCVVCHTGYFKVEFAFLLKF